MGRGTEEGEEPGRGDPGQVTEVLTDLECQPVDPGSQAWLHIRPTWGAYTYTSVWSPPTPDPWSQAASVAGAERGGSPRHGGGWAGLVSEDLGGPLGGLGLFL